MQTKVEKANSNSFIKVTLPAIFCTILWGSAFPSVKIGYELFEVGASDTFKKILFAGTRFAIAGAVVLLVLFIVGKKVKITSSDIPDILVLSLTQTAIQYSFFYIALSNMSGSKGSMLNSTSVFFSVIFAHFMFKEDRLTTIKTLGCLVGFIGVIIVNFSKNESYAGFSLMGEGFMLVSAASTGISYPITKRLTNKGFPPVLATGWQLLIGGVLLVTVGLLGGARLSVPSWKAALLLGHLIFISAAAFSIWNTLIKHNPVGKVVIFNFMIPIFGTVLSGIFLKEEIFSVYNLVALVLVAAGIALVNYTPVNAKK